MDICNRQRDLPGADPVCTARRRLRTLLAAMTLSTMATSVVVGGQRAADVLNASPVPQSSGLLTQGRDGTLLLASGARISHEPGSFEKLGSFLVGLGYGAPAFDSAALCAVRLTPRGTLDEGFGTGGSVVTPLLPLQNRNQATVTALLQDEAGRAILVGWRSLPTALDANVMVVIAARYSARGQLDASFGERGIVTTRVDKSAVTQAFAAALDSEGRLLVGGYSGGRKTRDRLGSFDDWSIRTIVLRYTTRGVLDASFGEGGIAVQAMDPSGQDKRNGRDFLLYDYKHVKAAGLTVDRLGRPVLAASTGDGSMVLTRYAQNGRLDSTFGSGGNVRTSVGGASSISTLVSDSEGRLLAVGTSGDSLMLTRYSADGVVDPAFGDLGIRRTPTSAGMRVSAALQEGDGHLLVVASGEKAVLLARYDSQGRPEGRFGPDGVIHTASDKRLTTPAGLAIEGDGTPAVAAFSEDGIFLVRYNREGPVDLSFRLRDR